MTYRRDVQADETIPLPIETVYNSTTDSLKIKNDDNSDYYHGHVDNFNRLYFKYPPEWKTSNIGDKIIGVRNMSIKLRNGELNFRLYVRMYYNSEYERKENILKTAMERSDAFDDCDCDELHQIIIDNMDLLYLRVIEIPVNIKVSPNDKWIDVKEQIRKAIDQNNLYNYLRERILKRKILTDAKLELLRQLELIKNDHNSMLAKSNELTGERIDLYLRNIDVDIIDTFENGEHVFKFEQHYYDSEIEYSLDFLIMNDIVELQYSATYEKFYPWPSDLKTYYTNSPSPYSYMRPLNLFEPEEEEDEVYIPNVSLNHFDRFDKYTANFFNIGTDNPHKNSLKYVTTYHDVFELKNIMSDLQCEVAASFASQSNHNIIGRTNETFTPIKYYKLNDNDDTFWIEFYDKNEINVPIAINKNVTFTIDMVFLQNRKLLYS